MTYVEVYLPVKVGIDTETGELGETPYVDWEGQPWPDLGGGNIWAPPRDGAVWDEEDEDAYDWIKDRVLEDMAEAALTARLQP